MDHDNVAKVILTELNDLKKLLEKNQIIQFSSEIEILKDSVQSISQTNDKKQVSIDLFYLIERIYTLTEKIENHKEAVFGEIANLKQFHQAAHTYHQNE